MPGKFCVSLNSAKDNTDKATVAFVVANAAVASDKETIVFLSTEGVRLDVKGYAEGLNETECALLPELKANFAPPRCTSCSVSPFFTVHGLYEATLMSVA